MNFRHKVTQYALICIIIAVSTYLTYDLIYFVKFPVTMFIGVLFLSLVSLADLVSTVYTTCPKCGGVGSIPTENLGEQVEPGKITLLEYKECPRCKGTGDINTRDEWNRIRGGIE